MKTNQKRKAIQSFLVHHYKGDFIKIQEKMRQIEREGRLDGFYEVMKVNGY